MLSVIQYAFAGLAGVATGIWVGQSGEPVVAIEHSRNTPTAEAIVKVDSTDARVSVNPMSVIRSSFAPAPITPDDARKPSVRCPHPGQGSVVPDMLRNSNVRIRH